MAKIGRHMASRRRRHERHAAHHKPESAATRAKISAAEKGKSRKRKKR